MQEPITKDGLFKATERRLSKAGFEHLIERVLERHVDFQLSRDDEQKLRRSQGYLGKKRVDRLIEVVRSNYRAVENNAQSTVNGSRSDKLDYPPPLPVKKLTYSQEAVSSTRDDAPYAVRVVIQTNVVIQPTSLAIKCSSEFAAADSYLQGTGVRTDTGEGFIGDRTVYWFFFGSPAFKPETPVIVLLMAKQPIRVLGVQEGPLR